MSKNTKIILGVVGVLLVLGAARWAFTPKIGIPGMSSDAKGEYTIKSDDGQTVIKSGGSVPEDFPKDVPIYSGASVVSSVSGLNTGVTGYAVNFETGAAVAEVIAFYKDGLAKSGWKIVSTYNTGDTEMIVAQKDKMATMVSATMVNGKTQFIVTVGNN